MKRRDFLLKSTFTGLTLATGATPFVKTLFADSGKKPLLASATATPRILLATDASESEKFAAQELAEYLGKITGQKVTTIADTTAIATAKAPLIILGHHPLNSDLHPEKMDLEESVISVEENLVRIVGGALPPVTDAKGIVHARDRGTLYGVYHFLNSLGVRWYRPEPWGEHVPRLKSISLPLGKSTFKPVYKYRNSTSLYRWYPDQTKEQSAMALQWAVRNFISTNAGNAQSGGSYGVQVQHNYGALLSRFKYFKTHPEYFALINGKRVATAQPCLGSLEVQDIMAAAAVAFAKTTPQLDVISLSPNDGLNYCECNLCRALDDPNLLAKNGGEARLGNASMTNRVTYVNNLIAARMAKEVPDMKVGWYAYLGTSEVPTKVTFIEPNIYVAPTSMAAAYGDYNKMLDDPTAAGNANFLEILKGWSKMTPLLTREYWSGGCWYGPLPMLSMLKDRLTQYRKYRVDGVINESHPSWGPQTDIHYFLARLMWNPDLDLDRELEEFCKNYYGPAAQPMLEYHRLLDKASLNGPDWYFSGRFIDRLFVDEKLIDQMTVLMEKAKPLTQGQQPYERRFNGAWAGYEVARVRSLVERYKKEKNPLQAVAAWDDLQKFIKTDTSGEIFDAGPVMFKTIWKVMSDQAGIAGLRNQIATLKNTPGAAILQNLDENWKFSTDPQNQGLRKGVTTANFDDHIWANINTNSTWQDQGFNYHGTAWYRKTFTIASKEMDKKYALFFGSVDGDAIIYLNGKEVGKHILDANGGGWNDDFMMDITGALQAGKNTLAVQVTKDTAVAGITKGVTLMRI